MPERPDSSDMTPQEAVDLVVTTKEVCTQMHEVGSEEEWIEVYGFNWSLAMTRKGHGIGYRWPTGSNQEEATEAGTIQQCELTDLECSRIMNEVNRRLIH